MMNITILSFQKKIHSESNLVVGIDEKKQLFSVNSIKDDGDGEYQHTRLIPIRTYFQSGLEFKDFA